MRQSLSSLAVALFVTLTANAQTVGNYTSSASGSPALNAPFTVIDLTAPASGDVTIGTIAVRTTGTACEDGFKVRFYRRSGNSLTSVAERGPFSPAGLLTTIQLTPPVDILRHDLIGIVALKSCLVPSGQTLNATAEAVEFSGDVSSGNIVNGTKLPYFALAAYGAQNLQAEIRTQILVVAGAAAGAGGSQFRTDVFLTAPRQDFSSGRLVYHREATVGLEDDPSVSFTLEPGSSRTIANIIGSSLGLSGKGSVDVMTRIGFEPPIVAARVYDDGGSAGTKGFSFEASKPSEALMPGGSPGFLFTPQDKARFRMNVGIRTLDFATQIDYVVLTATGAVRGIVTQSYLANSFVQPDLNGLLKGMVTQPGDTIFISPVEAPAFVYGSIIDNATNDPSLQIAKALQ